MNKEILKLIDNMIIEYQEKANNSVIHASTHITIHGIHELRVDTLKKLKIKIEEELGK